MTHRYSTALSYIVLAGTGTYCFKTAHYPLTTLPSVGYGLVIAHSIFGIWKWGNPDHGDISDKVYQWAKFFKEIFTFPCFMGQLYIHHGYQAMYGHIHPGISLFPLILRIKDDEVRDDVVDSVLALNIISGAIVSVLNENYWGIATVLSFGFQHFALAKGHESIDIPPVDLCNYAFCFVCYFALRALRG